MQKPTLVILAAGMASRFGRLKQIEGLGPSGETIIDYSIYDAIEAGFGKIVLVIREATHDYFQEHFGQRYGHQIELAFVDQELHKIPEGATYDSERQKPWGTGHALLMAKDEVHTPFLVINGDDFYGREAFKEMAQKLQQMDPSQAECCMIAYRLQNTLSDFGTVSRGVCCVNDQGVLTQITERTAIERQGSQIVYQEEGQAYPLDKQSRVSMNFWGMTPLMFEAYAQDFKTFIAQSGMALKSEFFLPAVINHAMSDKGLRVKVYDSNAQWFGITYPNDVENAKQTLNELVRSGRYPSPLHD